MNKNIFPICILITGIFLVNGCVSGHSPTDESAVTLLPTKTSTPVPISTRTLTLTVIPSATSTIAPSPLPTLSPTEAQNLILDLLQNNAGCRLPCWWGVTPGVTRWDEARRFLETFAEIIDYPGSPTDKIYNPEVIVPVPEDVHPLQHLGYTYYTTNEGGSKVIKQISVSTGNVPAYRLSKVLSDYGQPDEVWLLTLAGSPSSKDVPFDIVLFYSTQGFAARYLTRVSLRMPIIGCPQQAMYPELWLWSAEERKTFAVLVGEARSLFGTGSPSYLPLEQATGMSIETFYNTFKGENNTTCLETPFELWLYPSQTVISTTVGPVMTKTPTP